MLREAVAMQYINIAYGMLLKMGPILFWWLQNMRNWFVFKRTLAIYIF